jgi:aminopeptidase N
MNKLFFLLIPFFSFAQQFTKVDFIQCDASVALDFESKSIDGTISYKFQVLSEIDSIRIDAKNMYFKDVAVNGKLVNYKNNKKELILFEGYKKGRNEVSFSYKAMPKQTLYFFGVVEEQQIWTQGQGKYTSNWLPSFDDVNEKVVFNLFVNNKNKFQVVSNGILESKSFIIDSDGSYEELYEDFGKAISKLPKHDVDNYLREQVIKFIQSLN